jgi:hypothetical protein
MPPPTSARSPPPLPRKPKHLLRRCLQQGALAFSRYSTNVHNIECWDTDNSMTVAVSAQLAGFTSAPPPPVPTRIDSPRTISIAEWTERARRQSALDAAASDNTVVPPPRRKR